MVFRQDKLNKLLNISREYCALRQLKDIQEDNDSENDSDIEDNFECKMELREGRLDNKDIRDLTIRPLIASTEDRLVIHPQLPNIPFSFYVVGARDSGKSVLTQQLGDFTNGLFDEVYFWSPTARLDSKWRKFYDKMGLKWKIGKNVFLKYSEKILSKLMNKLEKKNRDKEFKDKMRVLFIFDDIIKQLPKGKMNTKFNNLILNNRHYNASVVIISQIWKGAVSDFRCNCSQIAIWDIENTKEKEKILEELGGSKYLGNSIKECKSNFLNLWDRATSKKHGCLYINYHSPDLDKRYNINFDISMPISHLKNNDPEVMDNVLMNEGNPVEEDKEEGFEETKEEDEEHPEDIAEQDTFDIDTEDPIPEEEEFEEGNLDDLIKGLMKKKKKELQELAEKNGVDIKKPNGKSKTKKDLIMEILEVEDLQV